MKILSTALHSFRNKLGQVTFSEYTPKGLAWPIIKSKDQSESCSKSIYKSIINSIYVPLQLNKWVPILNVGDTPDICKQAIINKILNISEIKIKEFNFKMLHYTLVCKNYLSKFKQDIDKNCEVCKEPDRIEHLIFYCSLANQIWKKVEIIVANKIYLKDIVLGIGQNPIDYIYSLIAFSIYKYWLQCQDNKEERIYRKLQTMISIEFENRLKMLKVLPLEHKFHKYNNILKLFHEKW